MDTIAARWARLSPHVEVFGPEDDRPRPAVILFHGCGGLREHIRAYAKTAAEAGFRAFAVDSYAPRGWNRTFGVAFVCTGLRFWGRERAGDVLAAVWGVAKRPDVDASKLSLAGWSHGSWSIMDLMTMTLDKPGHAGLIDPAPEPLDGVKSVFLVYPYGGPGALSRERPWVRKVCATGVIAERDHITSAADAKRLYEAAHASGCEVELWSVDGTHAFDEENTGLAGIMRHDPALTEEAHRRFAAFLRHTLGAPVSEAAPAEAEVAPEPSPKRRRAARKSA